MKGRCKMKGKKLKFRTLAVKDLDSLIKPLLWIHFPNGDEMALMGDITFVIRNHEVEWGNNDKFSLLANEIELETSNDALWLEEEANRTVKRFVRAALGVK